jgi:hypothetical protein
MKVGGKKGDCDERKLRRGFFREISWGSVTRKSSATVNRAEDAIMNWRCDKSKETMVTGRNEDGSKQTLDRIIDKKYGEDG